MRILLIQPPVQDFYQTGIRTYPLGLTSLAGVLQENDFEVEILDAHDPGLRQSIPLPAGFRYIRKYYAPDNKSPFRLCNHYYHFGLPLAEIGKIIRRRKPDLVGIASLFTPYSDIAIGIARLVKEIDPQIITVMGGHHVWSMPEHVLASGVVDFIIRGEAEWSLLALCRELSRPSPVGNTIQKIPGIGFQHGKNIFLHPGFALIEDLDGLPLPARNLLDPGHYIIGGRRYTMLLTSRGCPHSCGFCAMAATPCARFRHRSPENVLSEISLCNSRHGITHFDIEDDNFTAKRNHAETILDGIRAMSLPDVRLSAMNGISAYSLTPKLIRSMDETGFSHLDLALVTEDRSMRRSIARPGGLDQFDIVLQNVRTHKFQTTVHIILGLPEDSIDNMLHTIVRLIARPCFIGANIYYPVPGSALFEKYPEHIRFAKPSFWRSTLASCEGYHGQRDDYMTLFYLVRIINHLKHLLARHGDNNGGLTFAEAITYLVDRLAGHVKHKLSDSVIPKESSWPQDALGAFMLGRFAATRCIEKVETRYMNGGKTYLFSEEFCQKEIMEEFWQSAKSTHVFW